MLLAAIVLSFQMDKTFSVGYLTAVCSFFAVSSVIYDENENGYPFLMTLPAMRKTFVREKYLFVVLCGCGAWIIAVLIADISKMAGEGSLPDSNFYLEAVLVIPVVLLMAAVVFPFQFKFGADRGKFVVLIVLGIVFLFGYLISEICAMIGFDWQKLSDSLFVLREGMIEPLAIAVSAVVLVISCGISSNIMMKREL